MQHLPEHGVCKILHMEIRGRCPSVTRAVAVETERKDQKGGAGPQPVEETGAIIANACTEKH